jgi:hypothetical protein
VVTVIESRLGEGPPEDPEDDELSPEVVEESPEDPDPPEDPEVPEPDEEDSELDGAAVSVPTTISAASSEPCPPLVEVDELEPEPLRASSLPLESEPWPEPDPPWPEEMESSSPLGPGPP